MARDKALNLLKISDAQSGERVKLSKHLEFFKFRNRLENPTIGNKIKQDIKIRQKLERQPLTDK